MLHLVAGPATATVVPAAGGRVGSLLLGDIELLVTGTADDHPMLWGSFPMAPYAGRVSGARFEHEGETFELRPDLPPHAAHGTTYTRPWDVTSADDTVVELACPLDWALGGAAAQRIELTAGALSCELSVTAGDRSMPAEIGWHPWFRIAPRTELVAAVQSGASAMYVRGGDGIPSGRLTAPPPPPWDDCFTVPVPIEVPVAPGVTLTSDCDHLVVFDGQEWGVAVEPQSGPADAFHLRPRVLRPGETLRRRMAITWADPADAAHGAVTAR